jgi:thioredoxin reductase
MGSSGLESSEKNMIANGEQVDYLILGAGPSGLQLGYFLAKAGLRYQILEAAAGAGEFFRRYPRHRQLISINKIYTGYDDPERNLRYDWNSLICDDERFLFKNYTKKYFPQADVMVRYLEDFANHYKLAIKYNTRAVRITKNADGFQIEDQNGQIHCGKRLIVATGFTKAYIPPIPGMELCETYQDVSVDPKDFVDQKVLIVGKGNSAFETADNLVETAAIIHVASPHSVVFAWRTHFVGHLRALNNNIIDTYQLKSQNAMLDCEIERVEKLPDGKLKVSVHYKYAHGEREDLIYDRVILCTGWRMDPGIFDDSCKPELAINNRFPKQTCEWESVNVPGLYFSGTLTQQRDFKKTTSGFIHGFRYNVRALARILEKKYHGKPWPSTKIPGTPEAITRAILERVNKSSALWQQFGFLGDAFFTNPDGSFSYYEELPVAYIHESEIGQKNDYYVVTLEYGDTHDHDLIQPRGNYRPEKNDAVNAHLSPGLHPIVRRYNALNKVAEHHVMEDLYSEWMEDVHEAPLLEFFQSICRPSETVVA